LNLKSFASLISIAVAALGRPQAEARHGMKLTHKFAVPAPKSVPKIQP
jgi:hypothetical protein